MTIETLNGLDSSEAAAQFNLCCGATNWIKIMNQSRPFQNKKELFQKAESIWLSLSSEDWLEAFTHHPKIGNINSLRKKFRNTKSISKNEQSGVNCTKINLGLFLLYVPQENHQMKCWRS